MKNLWKQSIFWENMKKSCAILGGPVTAGFHQFQAADVYVWLSGSIALLGALLAIWATDNNKDGTVDLFE